MTAISNVSLTNTFDEWRTITNQLVFLANEVEANGNLVRVQSNTSAIKVTANIGRGDTIYITANVSYNIADQSKANLASANVVNAVHDVLTVAFAKANSANLLAFNSAAGSNAWVNTVFGFSNSYAQAVGAASNLVAGQAFNKANVANITADLAFDKANAANLLAFNSAAGSNAWTNTVFGFSNTLSGAVFYQANQAFAKANTANVTADLAFNKANAANLLAFNSAAGSNAWTNTVFGLSNSYAELVSAASNLVAGQAFTKANTANITADAAFNKANAANVLAFNSVAGANAWTNTVFGLSNSYAQTVGAASNLVAGQAFNKANVANITADAAFNKANAANVLAFNSAAGSNAWTNTVFGLSNSYAQTVGAASNVMLGAAFFQANQAYFVANVASGNTVILIDGAFGQANQAMSQANQAFAKANAANVLAFNALPNTAGITTAGILYVPSGLYVRGQNTIMQISDFANSMILSPNSASWKTSIRMQSMLTSSNPDTIDFWANNGSRLFINNDGRIGVGTTPSANLHVVGNVIVSTALNIGAIDVAPAIGSAFDKANAANVLAFNSAAGSNAWSNTVFGLSNSYAQTVGTAGNNYTILAAASSNAWTNTVYGFTNSAIHIIAGAGAFNQANQAWAATNTLYNTANTGLFGAAAYLRSNLAFNQANIALSQANQAFAKANATTYTSNIAISVTDNTNAALKITQSGTGYALLVTGKSSIDSNGRVGIGTVDPAVSLDINGTSLESFVGTGFITGNVLNVTAVTSGTLKTGDYITSDSLELDFGVYIKTANTGTGGIGTYFLSEEGNVTSGTVRSTDLKDKTIRITKTDAVIQAGEPIGMIQFNSDDANLDAKDRTRAFIGAQAIDTSGSVDLVLGTSSSSNPTTEAMRVNYNGDVGIGIKPTQKLTVNGSANVIGTLTSKSISVKPNTNDTSYIEYYANTANPTNRYGYTGFGSSGGNNFTILNQTSTGNIVLGTQSSNRMWITYTGNVGIGTSTPLKKLDVWGDIGISYGSSLSVAGSTIENILYNFWNGGQDQLQIQAAGDSAGIITLHAGSSGVRNEIARITASGIGIGITPTSNLHVAGIANITSTLLVGTINVAPTIGTAFDKANAANVLAFNSAAGANAWTNTVFGLSNSYTQTVGSAGNNYAGITVSAAANGWANTIGARSNAYALLITGAAFDKANAANVLAFTSGNEAEGAFLRGNVAFSQANQAFAKANAYSVLNETTSATRYVLFTSVTSGTVSTLNVSSAALTFNPSTGQLGATVFNSLSDRDKKENISIITDAITKTKQLNGVQFTWKDNGNPSAGIIAQDLQKVMPELVSERMEVNYSGIIGLLVEAIKELNERIKILESK